jgi:Tol biopolymer transport system component/outer membrane protein assembly factor BamB
MQQMNPGRAEANMNSRKKSRPLLLPAFGAIALLSTLLLMESHPSSQEIRQRSPELIREVYDVEPTRHWLPTAVEEPAPPVESESLTAPPSWSRLAFFSYRNYNWDIYLVDPDGSDEVRLTTESSAETYPWLKTGCEQVLFASDRDGNYEIYVALTDGSSLQRLTYDGETDTFPAWSSDGTRIAFQSYRTGNSDIFVMNADGSNLIQLTNSGAYDGQPSWSPDGAHIAFSSERSGGNEIWIMNADGSNPHLVTASGSALYPAWSPDGNKIAYANDGDGDGWLEIWQMNADGSAPEQLYSPGSYTTDLWGPAWSPDGSWLAVIRTTWTLYGGQWYWTHSYLELHGVGGAYYPSPVSDDRVWKAHWATTDTSPPGPCTLSMPAEQRWGSFLMSWSAEDVGVSGIDSYDVQVRTSATGPWQELMSWAPSTTGLYQGNDIGNPEFRCRARDRAGNQANWEDALLFPTSVDAAGPHSQMSPSPQYVRDSSVLVRWAGTDQGSGIASYDVLVRDGTDGNWQVWQEDVSVTAAQFNGSPGHTYYFRSQAQDVIGHVEPWQPLPQEEITFYTHVLSGTVTDQRGYIGLLPAIHLEPALAYVPPDPSSGVYSFYLGQVATATLDVSATGYGALPPTDIPLAQDARFDVVLPPEDEAVANGGFETGTLDGWSVLGHGAQVVFPSGHTGEYGLKFNHGTTATTELSQTIPLSETLYQPTLSFLYRIPTDLEGGEFSVRVITATVVHTSAATEGWVHVWSDLSPYTGQVVTLTLELTGTVGALEVDEVSVGSWQTPLVQDILPSEWLAMQAPHLTIIGQNFVATPVVFLGSTELANVTWVSETLLTADAPQGLADGVYDLTVANPNGSATILPDAATVTWQRALLPIVVRNTSQASSLEQESWPTLSHDARHNGYNGADPGASRYALVWTAALPFSSTRELESIAVADGIVVASNDSRLGEAAVMAFEAATGREIWRRPFSDKYSVNPPSIAHGAVYFQEGNHSEDSYLFCLDLYTGVQHWQAPFGTQWERYLAPIIVGDAVYMNAGYYGGMYGFRAGSGQQLWFTGLEQYDKWTPAYADGNLYTWVGGTFRAHTPVTGEILWSLELGPGSEYCGDTTPVLAEQTAVVAGCVELDAVNLSTHNVRWTKSGNYAATIPAVVDGEIYALNGGTLEAQRLSDGALLWGFAGDGNLKNAPVVAGGYVYIASEANTYVLNRTTHQVEWQTDHGGWLAIADGFLYIAQPDKTMYAYRAQEP